MLHEKENSGVTCFCFMRTCSYYIEYGISVYLDLPAEGTQKPDQIKEKSLGSFFWQFDLFCRALLLILEKIG